MGAAGWLKDAPFDLTLIVGVTGVACAMGGAVWIEPALFLPLLLFHTWAFGFDHVIATFTRLAGTPADRRRHRFLLVGLPPLLLVATLGVGQSAGLGALNTIYFVYQWFHTTRQSWGLMQHYRRAAGGLADEPRWLAELTAWALPTVGLLARGHESPARFLWIDLLYALGDRVDDWLDGRIISVSLTIAFTVNFHHYIVDGVIWKRRPAQ